MAYQLRHRRSWAETNLLIRNSTAEFLIFTTQAGESGIEVRYEEETIWLTQKMMAELFAVSVPTINEHLKNIFDSSELSEDSVIKKFRTTASDGKEYNTNFYNLDVIMLVLHKDESNPYMADVLFYRPKEFSFKVGWDESLRFHSLSSILK